MPIYKHLIEAGFDIVTYDLRNHGDSDVHNGGRIGLTHVEYQDSIASIQFARRHFPQMGIYLYSQCYGAVSTMRAMQLHPEEFVDVQAFINIQPLSADAFVNGVTRKFGLEHESNVSRFSTRLKSKTGYGVDQLRVPDIASSVKVPTLLVQVQEDWRTTVDDLDSVYDKLGTEDKKMLWIRNQPERLEGYNYFAHHPEDMLDWLDRH
jgi:alpha-beta hydrolase superfamily lysophospholipase